jgi:hypothetical protein
MNTIDRASLFLWPSETSQDRIHKPDVTKPFADIKIKIWDLARMAMQKF